MELKRLLGVLLLALPWSLAAQTGTTAFHLTAFNSTQIAAVQPPLPGLADDRNMATNDGTLASTDFYFDLLNPSISGNTIVIGYTYQSTSATVTISDDKSNTWVKDSPCNDGTHSHNIAYVIGAAAGTLRIHFNFSAAVGDFQAHAAQFYNVTGVDGTPTCTANQTGPNVTAGSITTTQANDLIFAYAADEAGFCCTNIATGFVPGTSFNLLPVDKRQGTAAEFRVYTSTGAINPGMTINQSSHDQFGMAAIAFKSGSAGSAPSGIWIYCQGEDHPNATAYSMQAPCPAPVSINLIVATTNSAPTYNTFTAPNDSDSNSYSGVSVSGLYPYLFYVQNATFSNSNSRTMTWNNANSSTEAVEYYAVGGAAASSFDSSALNAGTQSSQAGSSCVNSSNSNSTASLTPSTNKAGIVFVVEGNGDGPECNTSGTNNVYDEMWYAGATDDDTPNYTASGYAHLTYTSNSAQTLTFNWANTQGASTWNNTAAAFHGP